MRTSYYVVPAALFAAGAVIGRVVGLKALTKGAVAAAAFAGIGPKAIVKGANRAMNGRRRAAAVRKRSTSRKSPGRKLKAA